MIESPPDAEAIRRYLIAEVAKLTDVDVSAVDPREPFSRYGLDSLGSLGLAANLERVVGRKLPITLIWDYPSIESLSIYLAEEFKREQA